MYFSKAQFSQCAGCSMWSRILRFPFIENHHGSATHSRISQRRRCGGNCDWDAGDDRHPDSIDIAFGECAGDSECWRRSFAVWLYVEPASFHCSDSGDWGVVPAERGTGDSAARLLADDWDPRAYWLSAGCDFRAVVFYVSQLEGDAGD